MEEKEHTFRIHVFLINLAWNYYINQFPLRFLLQSINLLFIIILDSVSITILSKIQNIKNIKE